IRFLWEPQKYFSSLRKNPNILFPIFIVLVLVSIPIFTSLIFINPFRHSTHSDPIRAHIIVTLITVALPLIISTFYFYIIYWLMGNKQSFKLLLSIILHANLASTYFLFLGFLLNVVSGSTKLSYGLSSPSYMSLLIFFIYLG